MSLADKLMRYGVDALPHLRCVYNKKLEFIGALRQNLSRLRVEKLGCAGSRQAGHPSCQPRRFDGQLSPRLYQVVHCMPLAYLYVAPPACGSQGRSGRQSRSFDGHARVCIQ
jgi:hypothetical protein